MRIWYMCTCLMKILEAEITRKKCRSSLVLHRFSCMSITLISYNVDTAFSFLRVGECTLLLKVKKYKEKCLLWAEQYREIVKRNYGGTNRGGFKGNGAWLVYLYFFVMMVVPEPARADPDYFTGYLLPATNTSTR